MHRLLILFSFLIASYSSFATIVKDTLYINRDTVDQAANLIHYCSFNNTSTFELTNAPLELNLSDSMEITIINTDSLVHTFTVNSILETGNTILANDTSTFSWI